MSEGLHIHDELHYAVSVVEQPKCGIYWYDPIWKITSGKNSYDLYPN